MDFNEIPASSKDERIRAWCVDLARTYRRVDDADVTLVNTAAVIEHYVKTGEITVPQLEAVYEEALVEGRFEAKLAIVEDISGDDPAVELVIDHLFVRKGWQQPPPEDPGQIKFPFDTD